VSLDELLANWRGEAAVLRARGHVADAKLLEQCADEVADTSSEYLTWLSEREAILYSGRSVDYLRGKFEQLALRGLAKAHGRTRYYRRACLEHRGNAEAARAAGRRAAGDAA
jgi:hypothetical protein